MYFITDFIPYQKYYYLIYQSFDADSKMCVQRVEKQYSIPQEVLHRICSIENNRLCNLSLWNYLLIELRKEKDEQRFLQVVKSLITKSTLLRAVQNIHKGLCACLSQIY